MISKKFLKQLKKNTTTKVGKHTIISNVSKKIIDGPMRGWLCGHFYPKKSVFHRNDIEICFKTLPKGMTEDKHFHLCSFEFLIVLSGSVEYAIDNKKKILNPGMFYILEPGATENITRLIRKITNALKTT